MKTQKQIENKIKNLEKKIDSFHEKIEKQEKRVRPDYVKIEEYWEITQQLSTLIDGLKWVISER